MRGGPQKVWQLFKQRCQRIKLKKEPDMPKFTCIKCSHEFWGWGVPYQFRSGDLLVCPDCDGSLIEVKEKPASADIVRGLFNGTAA